MNNVISNNRNTSIDFIKGIAIFSVVLAHCWLIDREIFHFIYSFHMPLFFCISGYLFSNKKKYKDFFIGKFKNLILPYIIFFAFSYILSTIIFQRDISILHGLEYMILGGKYCSKVCNWALWYLQLFFIASNIFYFISKIKYSVVRYLILIGLFIVSLPIQQWCNNTFENGYVPFALNALCPALFFMLIAFEFKKIKEYFGTRINSPYKSIITVIASTIFFVTGLVLAAGNSDQIITLKSYTFLIYSLLILQFIVLICQNCNNKYIVYIGKNSLVILGIHRLLLYVCSDYLPTEQILSYLHINHFAGAILVSILCIFSICLLNYIVETIFKKIKTLK